jgi:hypothetical protein
MIGVVKLFKSAEQKQDIAEAETAFQEIARRLATSDPQEAQELVSQLDGAAFVALGKRERKKLGEQAFMQ